MEASCSSVAPIFDCVAPTCEVELRVLPLAELSATIKIQKMSYTRLLRLPLSSEAVSPHWRRQLSGCSRNGGSGSLEHSRTASRRFRTHHPGLGREGGEGIPKAVENRVSDGADASLLTAGAAEAAARRAGAASRRQATAVRRFQTSFAHGEEAFLRSRHQPPSSRFWGAAGAGWKYGSRGGGLQSQSLRAFASTPPPDQAAKPSSTGPRQRASLGDLLKPSDVSK